MSAIELAQRLSLVQLSRKRTVAQKVVIVGNQEVVRFANCPNGPVNCTSQQ